MPFDTDTSQARHYTQGMPKRTSDAKASADPDKLGSPNPPLDFPVAVNSGPLPLVSGVYEWRLTIDGQTDDDWRLPFSVRAEEDEVR